MDVQVGGSGDIDEMIVGGKEASVSSIPWQVGIKVKEKRILVCSSQNQASLLDFELEHITSKGQF